MMHGPELGRMFGMGLGAEMIYSFVIVISSLMIYFGTKELYELSSHKGIRCFRQAFLFFALAYFFRSFIKIVLSYFNVSGILEVPMFLFGPIALFLFVYLSSIAVFYLLNSIMWKKWGNGVGRNIAFHLIAILIAGINIYFNSTVVFVWSHLLIFVFIIASLLISSERIRKHRFYLIYILIFIFWVLNVIDVLVPKYLQSFQLFIYLSSTWIFLAILYKVMRIVGPD